MTSANPAAPLVVVDWQVALTTAARLVSLHNIAWTLALLDRAREAIAAGRFDAFRRDVLSVWG